MTESENNNSHGLGSFTSTRICIHAFKKSPVIDEGERQNWT